MGAAIPGPIPNMSKARKSRDLAAVESRFQPIFGFFLRSSGGRLLGLVLGAKVRPTTGRLTTDQSSTRHTIYLQVAALDASSRQSSHELQPTWTLSPCKK